MPDRMTDDGPVAGPTTPTRRRWAVPAGQAGVILALFAGAGWLCGWLWWKFWSPAPTGVVFGGSWYPDPAAAGLSAEFAGTGTYVVVAVVGGLILGLVAGLLLDRDEIVTLVAVAAGSLLAGWLMHRVGVGLSPPDPAPLAKTLADETRLPGHLVLGGDDVKVAGVTLGRPPLLAFPFGAMAGLVLALFGISKPARSRG